MEEECGNWVDEAENRFELAEGTGWWGRSALF